MLKGYLRKREHNYEYLFLIALSNHFCRSLSADDLAGLERVKASAGTVRWIVSSADTPVHPHQLYENKTSQRPDRESFLPLSHHHHNFRSARLLGRMADAQQSNRAHAGQVSSMILALAVLYSHGVRETCGAATSLIAASNRPCGV